MSNLIRLFLLSTLYLLFACSTKKSAQNEKIWAHRVNSIEKLVKASNDFSGLELDLVITENCLDISHPPEAFSGLCLSQYLKDANNINPNLNFWLDIKNLSEDNILSFLTKMDKICIENNISKQHLILESPEWKLLDQLSEKGYQTSYYLPGINDFLEKDRSEIIQKIFQRISEENIKTISTGIDNYEHLKIHFKSHQKLLWATGSMYEEYHDLYSQALSDSTVKVILISF